MEGESWAPLGETCWYGVDLLRPVGPLTVERRRNGRRETALLLVGGYPYEVQRVQIEDEAYLHLSPANLARVKREQAEVAPLFALRGPPRFTLPLLAPLENAAPGRYFGAKRILNGEPRSPHGGADFAAPAGTPIRAAADGTVALSGEHFFAGRCVFLDHGDGLISMYFHLSHVALKDGRTVKRGERIGAVGATGRASGPHLHFALRWRGARIDPAVLLGDPEAVPAIRAAPR